MEPDETMEMPKDKIKIWRKVAIHERKIDAKLIANELGKIISQMFGGKHG